MDENVELVQQESQDSQSGEVTFLDRWKTPKGMAVLGLFCSNLAGGLAALFDSIPAEAAIAISVGYCVCAAIYALAVYPTYFTDHPAISSVKLAGFLNCFFGYIWGLLWNGNLTKRKRGISHYVYVVMLVLLCASELYMANGGFIDENSQEAPLYAIQVGDVYTDEDSGELFWSYDGEDDQKFHVEVADALVDMGLAEDDARAVVEKALKDDASFEKVDDDEVLMYNSKDFTCKGWDYTLWVGIWLDLSSKEFVDASAEIYMS